MFKSQSVIQTFLKTKSSLLLKEAPLLLLFNQYSLRQGLLQSSCTAMFSAIISAILEQTSRCLMNTILYL